jgi:hypothetical protein
LDLWLGVARANNTARLPLTDRLTVHLLESITGLEAPSAPDLQCAPKARLWLAIASILHSAVSRTIGMATEQPHQAVMIT